MKTLNLCGARAPHLLTLLLIMLCAAGIHARAQGNIHFGGMAVHPYVKLAQRHDDNIYLTPDDEKDDWITTMTPGMSLAWPVRTHFFGLEYFVDVIEYWDYTDESTQDHSLSFLGDMKSPRGVFCSLDNNFRSTSDPATSELTDREERIRNVASVSTGARREKLRFDLRYENIWDDYRDLDTLDKREDIYTVAGHYRVLPKTSVLLEYSRGAVTYDEDGDNADYDEANAGINGEWFPKVTGLLKVGYQWRDYEVAPPFDGGVATLSADWAALERTTVKATGRWGVDESTFENNRYYRFDALELEVIQGIGDKWSVSVSGSHERNMYSEDVTTETSSGERDDNIWQARMTGTYQIQDWLSARAGYHYKSRESSFDEFDYDNNRYSVEVAATF